MDTIKLGFGPLVGGILFSIGLGISGMTEPAKILSFLDIFGNWDPSLIFVMIGAISVNAVLHRVITKKSNPLFDSKFYFPTKTNLDKKLILGSALFGAGWGIAGLCPGPGFASISTGNTYALVFVVALVFGMILVKAVELRKLRMQASEVE